jgi:hypothetical protein
MATTLTAMVAEARRIRASLDTIDLDTLTDVEIAASERAYIATWAEADKRIVATEPRTVEDAVAVVQYARDDFYQFNMEGEHKHPAPGDYLWLAGFDKALLILRRLHAAGVTA